MTWIKLLPEHQCPGVTPIAQAVKDHLRPAVDVWAIEVAGAVGSLQALAASLDDRERHRAVAILGERRRGLFIVAHAGLRHILASYLGVQPGAVHFAAPGPKGKPALHPAHNSKLTFNLSHTRGLALVAIALGQDVGVDVEWTGRRLDPFRHRYLTLAERREIQATPSSERGPRLLEHWTRREAEAKLTGRGLFEALDSSCRTAGDNRAVVLDLTPTPEHVGALAVSVPTSP